MAAERIAEIGSSKSWFQFLTYFKYKTLIC